MNDPTIRAKQFWAYLLQEEARNVGHLVAPAPTCKDNRFARDNGYRLATESLKTTFSLGEA
jgi:hypothetical protein